MKTKCRRSRGRTFGLACALLLALGGGGRALAADAPLDTLREASAPAKASPYAAPDIDISRKKLPEVTATTVPLARSPKQPPRLDDPVAGSYRYHLARQAAVASNAPGINMNMKAAIQAAPDQPRYQWWQSVQAVKRLDTATLGQMLPASFRSMIDSPVGRGPFVIAAHQTALLATGFFWTVLVVALYLGWWRNIAHDIAAMLLKNPRHVPRVVLPLLLPLVVAGLRPGWFGFLAIISVPLLIQTRGRARGLLLATWLTAMALVFPGWPALRNAVPTVDPGSEVTLLDEALRMPPSADLVSRLRTRLGQAEDAARKDRLTVALAVQEARRGNYDESNRLFSQVLKQDPTNFAAMVGRANNVYYLGRLDEALAAYEEAGRVHPRRGEVLYNQAQVYFKKLFVPEAGEALEQARALGFAPIATDTAPTKRGGYSAVVYPPLTAREMSAACSFEAPTYPPLVTVASWQWMLGVPPLPLYILVGAPFMTALLLVMWWSRQNDPRECENCGTPLCANCCKVRDGAWLCAGCGETAERSKSEMVLATLLKNKSRAEGMAHSARIVRLGRFLPGAGHLATDHFWAGWLRISLVSAGLFLIFAGWAFDPGAELATPGLQLVQETIHPVWFPMPANLWPGWTGLTILSGAALLVVAWIIALLDGPGLRRGTPDRYSLATTSAPRDHAPGVGAATR
ncbi:MAG: tetratricopeptide repeat protein [Rhodocyclaceae bacterium]|nr:tetratricopeptide repeat protein [Rhodocyclaceae bacterium]